MSIPLSKYFSPDETKEANIFFLKEEKIFEVNCTENSSQVLLRQFTSQQQAEDFAEDFVSK